MQQNTSIQNASATAEGARFFTDAEIAARKALPEVNGYTTHRIVTLDRLYTYEQPVSYVVKRTAAGGWWGVCTYADGTVLKEFRKSPSRLLKRSEAL